MPRTPASTGSAWRGSSLAVATRAPPMVLIFAKPCSLAGLDQAVEVGHHFLAASASQ